MSQLPELIQQLIDLQTTANATLAQIQYYAETIAIAAGLTMGFVVWRLFLLSKNQKRLM